MEATHAQGSDARLTVSEAARVVGMSADTIRRYADAGTLPSFRTPGNQRRFIRADVEALLTSSSPSATPATDEVDAADWAAVQPHFAPDSSPSSAAPSAGDGASSS